MQIEFVSMWKIKLVVWFVLVVLGIVFSIAVMGAPTLFFTFMWSFLAGVIVLRAKA